MVIIDIKIVLNVIYRYPESEVDVLYCVIIQIDYIIIVYQY